MKPSYAPDNTRSSIVVILLLAAGVSIVAALMGLSDKPDVSWIGVSVTPAEAATLIGDDGYDPAPGSVDLGQSDTTGLPVADAGADVTAPELDAQADPSASESADDANSPAATIQATPVPIATETPTPIPQVAAAVEPTLIPDEGVADELDALAVPARITAGTVNGTFFTRPDEDEGATVNRNELTLTLNDDGTGSFAGVLDITLADTTQVTMAMSGPIRWSGDSPQVLADLTGNYKLDSPIDSDDVSSTAAELTITSLGSGTGSLCTPACFGFTFPPQTGL